MFCVATLINISKDPLDVEISWSPLLKNIYLSIYLSIHTVKLSHCRSARPSFEKTLHVGNHLFQIEIPRTIPEDNLGDSQPVLHLLDFKSDVQPCGRLGQHGDWKNEASRRNPKLFPVLCIVLVSTSEDIDTSNDPHHASDLFEIIPYFFISLGNPSAQNMISFFRILEHYKWHHSLISILRHQAALLGSLAATEQISLDQGKVMTDHACKEYRRAYITYRCALNYLATKALETRACRYHLRPKAHQWEHLVFNFLSLNPRRFSNYLDEDFVAKCKEIAVSTHPLHMPVHVAMRYSIAVCLRWHDKPFAWKTWELWQVHLDQFLLDADHVLWM